MFLSISIGASNSLLTNQQRKNLFLNLENSSGYSFFSGNTKEDNKMFDVTKYESKTKQSSPFYKLKTCSCRCYIICLKWQNSNPVLYFGNS